MLLFLLKMRVIDPLLLRTENKKKSNLLQLCLFDYDRGNNKVF